MESIIRLVSEQGIWVFLTGVITSILIGAIKTPIKAKAIPADLDEAKKAKREHIFDILVFIGTFVMAAIGAIVLCAITYKCLKALPVFKYSLSIWLAQSLVYGIWKKLGLKKLVQLLLKLFIKDTNKDGQITLSDAIEMVRNAWKNGKLDVDELLKESVDNATENLGETLSEASKGLEAGEALKAGEAAINGDYKPMASVAVDIVKDTTNHGVEVVKDGQTIIKF